MLRDSTLSTVGSENSDFEIVKFDGASPSTIDIQHSNFLFTADFSREGNDLLINGSEGRNLIIENYFANDTLADLIAPEGGTMRSDVVNALAGPDNPGVYAQAGSAAGATPIGQVEEFEGSVSVQRSDGTIEVLQQDSKVFQNDVVITEDGSTLSITFVDGTIFTLSEASRMVLSELVYTPEASNNSSVFNLVEGGFVFIAGEVAKTGEMSVQTPVATMGIRGTTVKVDVQTQNGVTTVEVSLNTDPDGSIGNFTITGLNGEVIGDVQAIDTKWIIAPDGNSATEVDRPQVEFGQDLIIINRAVSAYQNAQGRVQGGGRFVEQDNSAPDNPGEGNGDAPAQDGTGPEDGENPENQNRSNPNGTPGDQGQLNGSGLNTEFAFNGTNPDGSVIIPQLTGGNGPNTRGGGNRPLPPLINPDSGTTTTTVDPFTGVTSTETTTETTTTVAPSITLPTLASNILEDGSVELNGFNFASENNAPLQVTLTVGSTIRLAPGADVTIDTVNSIESPPGSGDYDLLIISGTPQQINDALNGSIYTASANDDDGGSLRVEAFDGTSTSVVTLSVGITPVEDPPIAIDDILSITEDSNAFTGSLFDINNDNTNDYDPDTGDTISVIEVYDPNEVFPDTGSSDPDCEVDCGGGASTATNLLGQTYNVPSGGTLVILATGEYSFDPGNAYDFLRVGETRTITINYTIEDSTPSADVADDRASATLTITVTGTNDAPIISGDLQLDAVINNKVTLTTADLGAADIEDFNSAITFTITSAPALGQVLVDGSASDTFTMQDIIDGLVEYSHTGASLPTDSFNVTVSDADGGTDTATISIAIENVAPVIDTTAIEATTDGVATGTLSASDANVGDQFSFVAETITTTNGSVTIAADGDYIYTPNAGFSGFDSFTAKAVDANGAQGSAEIGVEVANETASTNGGQEIKISIDSTSEEGNPYGNVALGLTSFSATNINLVFALDASGSVGSTAWATSIAAVSQTLDALATSLADSPVQVDVHIFQFAGSGILTLDAVEANDTIGMSGSNLTKFDLKDNLASIKTQLAAFPFSGGQTPWDEAFKQAQTFFEGEPAETNFMYFLTDGNPSPASQPWQTQLAALKASTNSDQTPVNVEIQAFGIGDGYDPELLVQVDSDEQPTEVSGFSDLANALNTSGLFPAEVVDFSLTLNVDGVDQGEIANEDSGLLRSDAEGFDVRLAEIDDIGTLLGDKNEFSLTTTIDLDGDTSTTADQIVLNSFEAINIGSVAVSNAGTEGNDLLLGSTQDDQLGGAGEGDVILAGAGNDIISVPDFYFYHLDGGAGIDTLNLIDSGLELDFDDIDNVKGIEKIDLGSQGNTIRIDEQQVIDLVDTTDLNLFGAGEQGLFITGDGNDAVTLDNSYSNNGGWILNEDKGAATESATDEFYDFVDAGGETLATVVVDDVPVTIVA